MANLMDLPVELRIRIYNYSFVVGKIYPYANAAGLNTTQPHPFHPPQFLSLLRANKIIHAEAEPFIYQKNTVVLPKAPWSAIFFRSCLNSTTKRLWLKDVELEMSSSDLLPFQSNILLHLKGLDSYSTGWDDSRLIKLQHDACRNRLVRFIWPEKLAPILEITRLEKITVNLADSRCIMRCCWSDLEACAAFSRGSVHGPPKISLPGLRLFDVDHWVNPDPEAYKRGEQGIAGMMIPIVTDDHTEVEWDVVRAGQQFGRWTAARVLGVQDGIRMWFRTAEEEKGEEARLEAEREAGWEAEWRAEQEVEQERIQGAGDEEGEEEEGEEEGVDDEEGDDRERRRRKRRLVHRLQVSKPTTNEHKG